MEPDILDLIFDMAFKYWKEHPRPRSGWRQTDDWGE
jgi:hypothetical protein